jgi:hypothetical protein
MKRVAQGRAAKGVSDRARLHNLSNDLGDGGRRPVQPVEVFNGIN